MKINFMEYAERGISEDLISRQKNRPKNDE
jgi:hypothetical protein